MQPFDEVAGHYDDVLRDPLRERFGSHLDFFIQQKCRVVAERLDRFERRATLRVLDAGCGQGNAFQFFGPHVRVFGCDVSTAMLRHAVVRGPVAVQEPYALPFADGTFDAVYAFCIYHHIPAEERVRHLKELRRVVRPGGEVMVFEHNPYNPVTRRIFRRAPVDQGCEMIAPGELGRMFRAAGFERLDHGYLLFVPEALHPWLGFLERWLSWLPLGGQYFVAGRNPRRSGT